MGTSTAGDDAPAAAASSSSGPSTSASSGAADAGGASATHYLAKRVLHGSAVQRLARGYFRSEDCLDVVLCKETSLELVMVGEDGVLQSICEQSTFGIIKDVGVLQWRYKHFRLWSEIEGKEILVVLSDSGKLSLLYFCSEMHRFFAIANIELSKPGNMRHQLGRILAIDQESAWVAVSAYEDEFRERLQRQREEEERLASEEREAERVRKRDIARRRQAEGEASHAARMRKGKDRAD